MSRETGVTTVDVDLKELPEQAKILADAGAVPSVTLPDLHGNTLLMLNRLHHAGVITLTDEQYQEFHELYAKHGKLLQSDKLSKKELKENVKSFVDLINKIAVNPGVFVRFIGDILADRGYQDYFTLYLLNHLKMKNAQFEIMFSNHDAGFIEAYHTKTSPKLSPADSYKGLARCAEAVVIPLSEEDKERLRTDFPSVDTLLTQGYFPCLQLISYEKSSDTPPELRVFTHAPIDLLVIEDAALFFEVKYDDTSMAGFIKTINAVNVKFKEQFSSEKSKAQFIREFNKQFQAKVASDLTNTDNHMVLRRYITQQAEEQSMALVSLTWTRATEVSNQKQNFAPRIGTTATKYLELPDQKSWQAQLTFIHGHIGEHDVQHTQWRNLDNTVVGKSPMYATCDNYRFCVGSHFTHAKTEQFGTVPTNPSVVKFNHIETELLKQYDIAERTVAANVQVHFTTAKFAINRLPAGDPTIKKHIDETAINAYIMMRESRSSFTDSVSNKKDKLSAARKLKEHITDPNTAQIFTKAEVVALTELHFIRNRDSDLLATVRIIFGAGVIKQFIDEFKKMKKDDTVTLLGTGDSIAVTITPKPSQAGLFHHPKTEEPRETEKEVPPLKKTDSNPPPLKKT